MPANTMKVLNNLTGETRRGRSQDLWRDAPLEDYFQDRGLGYYYYQDFTEFSYLTTPTITTVAALGCFGLKAFGSSGGTILPNFETGGGVVLTETDDNEGVSIQQIATPFKIIRGGGDLFLEMRMKTNSIADTDHGFFFGLAETLTLSATVPIAAAGTLADKNFVGFHRLEGDGDQLDTVYKADGVTQVTVKADALTESPVLTALVADTYFKIGLRYRDKDHKIIFYVNGVPLPTTYTVPSAAGTDFPNDVQLAILFAQLCASNNDAINNISWIEAFQGASS